LTNSIFFVSFQFIAEQENLSEKEVCLLIAFKTCYKNHHPVLKEKFFVATYEMEKGC